MLQVSFNYKKFLYNNKWFYLFKIILFCFTSSILLSCGKPKNYDFVPIAFKLSLPTFIKINTPEEISFSSKENYDENEFGLITATKLSNFAQNWSTNKTVQGKLVIFQIQSGNALNRFIPTSPAKDVYVYLLPIPSGDSIVQQTRNNGISSTESVVVDGSTIDTFLSLYGINSSRDLVVLSMDTSSSTNLQYCLRLYYTLRYWGFDKKNIAVLNGSIEQFVNSGELFTTTTRNTQIKQEFSSIKNLFVDNTSLQATLGDVIHILFNGNTRFEKVYPIPAAGVRFLDARSTNEFTPPNTNGQTNAPTGKTCQAGSNCKAPIDGRLKGAIHLEWSNLLENPNSGDFRFKSKATLKTIFQNAGLGGIGYIIPYSRIGFRATVPLFTSIAILGFPARLYDGSWIEFSSLASDQNGIYSNLLTSSPWRTDRATLVDSLTYTTATGVIPTFSYPTTSQFSTNSNKIIDDDKSYIRGVSSSSGSTGGATGGGGNACGG